MSCSRPALSETSPHEYNGSRLVLAAFSAGVPGVVLFKPFANHSGDAHTVHSCQRFSFHKYYFRREKIVVGRTIASNFSATHLGAVELSKLILVALPELN